MTAYYNILQYKILQNWAATKLQLQYQCRGANISQCRHPVNQNDPNISTKMKYFCLIVNSLSIKKIGKTKNAYLALNNTYLVGTKSSKSLFFVNTKEKIHIISLKYSDTKKISCVENCLTFFCVCWTYIFIKKMVIFFVIIFMSENWLVDFLFRKYSHITTHECVTKEISSDKSKHLFKYVFLKIFFPCDYLCCNYKHNQKHPEMHQRLDLCDKDSFLDQKLFSKPKQIFVVLHLYNR